MGRPQEGRVDISGFEDMVNVLPTPAMSADMRDPRRAGIIGVRGNVCVDESCHHRLRNGRGNTGDLRIWRRRDSSRPSPETRIGKVSDIQIEPTNTYQPGAVEVTSLAVFTLMSFGSNPGHLCLFVWSILGALGCDAYLRTKQYLQYRQLGRSISPETITSRNGSSLVLSHTHSSKTQLPLTTLNS